MKQEVAVVMGIPASGKSTYAKRFLDAGYARLNRDERDGSLAGLLKDLRGLLRSGRSVVLDNTYPTAESRYGVIAAADGLPIEVNCYWIATSIEDAQFNACMRMVYKYGKLFYGDEYKTANDPNAFPPMAQFHYRKVFEPPTKGEGFAKVEKIAFERDDGIPSEFRPRSRAKVLILDYDQTIRDTPEGSPYKYPTKEDEIVILPRRAETIVSYLADGYRVLGVSNQSGIAKGAVSAADANWLFVCTNYRLGIDIDYRFCPHAVPPISCWCRKPMPGLGVILICEYGLDPKKCIFVGDQKTDETFAKRCGFQYADQKGFFGC